MKQVALFLLLAIQPSSQVSGEQATRGDSSLSAESKASADSTRDAAAAKETRSFYLIGNSLTWDTVPAWMDGDVQWHVDCGKSLPFMYANPDEPCVKTSTLWPKALAEKQYDVVSMQSHYGAGQSHEV